MANKTLNTVLKLRSDTKANWDAHSTKVLLKGEVGIETDSSGKAVKLKIGDGTSTWANLPYFMGDASNDENVFLIERGTSESDDITLINAYVTASGKTVGGGDIAIVKSIVNDDTATTATPTVTAHYSYTAYVYNSHTITSGTSTTPIGWTAMDGNYSADNVYFKDDLVYTAAIGVLSKPTSSATLSAKGKSLKTVLSSIMAKRTQPTVTQPNATITLTNAGEYEVGTTVTPSWKTTFSKGSYTYGPTTAVTDKGGTVSNNKTSATSSIAATTINNKTGTLTDYVVTDAETSSAGYKVTLTYGWNADSVTPLDNLGDAATVSKIAAGTNKTTTSTGALVGYRSYFVGGDNKTTLTSADIRALTNKGKVTATTIEVKAADYAGCSRIVVALPSKTVSQVLLKSASNADITSEFKKQTNKVAVNGANNYTSANYDVWVYKPASLSSTEVYTITIS